MPAVLSQALLCSRLLDRYSFLDIGPLSKGHALIIPKCMKNLHTLATAADTTSMTRRPLGEDA